MIGSPSTPPPTPARALRVLRVLWLALLTGPLALLAVAAVVTLGGAGRAPDHKLSWMLFYLAMALLAMELPAVYFLRSQIYKKHWVADAVTPNGYFTGNLILLAAMEGTALFCGVSCLLTATLWPCIVPALLATGVQVINFPTGLAMQPTANPYQHPSAPL